MPPPKHNDLCKTKACYTITCEKCKNIVYFYECTCESQFLFDDLSEKWNKHKCFQSYSNRINQIDWIQKLQTGNYSKILDDSSILISLNLSIDNDNAIANGIIKEAIEDKLVLREMGGLIVFTILPNSNVIRAWGGRPGWDNLIDPVRIESTTNFPKFYGSISAVQKGMKSAVASPSGWGKAQGASVGFWLRPDVDYNIFRKYSIISGKNI